jgi:hypothetical protein
MLRQSLGTRKPASANRYHIDWPDRPSEFDPRGAVGVIDDFASLPNPISDVITHVSRYRGRVFCHTRNRTALGALPDSFNVFKSLALFAFRRIKTNLQRISYLPIPISSYEQKDRAVAFTHRAPAPSNAFYGCA